MRCGTNYLAKFEFLDWELKGEEEKEKNNHRKMSSDRYGISYTYTLVQLIPYRLLLIFLWLFVLFLLLLLFRWNDVLQKKPKAIIMSFQIRTGLLFK